MDRRRDFLRAAASGLGIPALAAAAGRVHAEGLDLALGDDPPGPSTSWPQTGSDIGSLYPFVERQAVRGEFPLSFLREEFRDLADWKRRARGRLLELLHYTPPKTDPRPEVLGRHDRGEYVEEHVVFSTTPDLRVPASVLIPKRREAKAPAIVALHDHGGFYLWGREKIVERPDEHPTLREFKRGAYAGRSIASELARRGYVVIAIDMFYWGERRMILDDDPEDWRTRPRSMPDQRVAAFNQRAGQAEQLVGRTIYSAGFTWSGVMFWDDIRTVDYLATRPEVDPDRIGCVGLSVGGLRSCHLAALDDRIKAAVVVGWMTSFPTQLKSRIRHTIGHTKLVPGLMREMDYPDVASLAMPAALLVINGSKDTLFEPAGVQASFAKLGRCYAKAGVPEKLRTRLYETPHEFNAEMQAEAWEWLGRWI
ncbi:MAG: alpha/beta hydrolase family protein [Isosphaeraceae bacterium]